MPPLTPPLSWLRVVGVVPSHKVCEAVITLLRISGFITTFFSIESRQIWFDVAVKRMVNVPSLVYVFVGLVWVDVSLALNKSNRQK